MKKSKLLILGMIALVLAGGLVLASCGACPDGDCSYNGNSTVDCKKGCITRQKEENPSAQKLTCDC